MAMNPKLLRPRQTSKYAALRIGLVAYWPMNETATSGDVTVEDWTKRGNNLTSNNSVLSTTGRIDNARDLVAANSEYLAASSDRADLRFMDGRSWTFACWLYIQTSWPTGLQAILSRDGVSAGQRETLLAIHTVSTLRRITWETGPGTATNAVAFVADQSTTGDRLAVDTWHFFAATYNASTLGLALRLNAGTRSGETATATRPAGTPVVGTRPFNLGRRPAGTPDMYLTGRLDEVAKWDRVLSAAEIDTLYNAGNGIDLRQ